MGFRSQALDLMGTEEDRGSPVFIPSICSICDSHEHSHRSTLAKAGSAPRETLVKTQSSKSFPGMKCTQWKPLPMRAVGPLESQPCMLHSQSDHAQLCVSRSFDVVWEHIVYNMISFRPYVPLSLPRLRHTGAFYVAGLVT